MENLSKDQLAKEYYSYEVSLNQKSTKDTQTISARTIGILMVIVGTLMVVTGILLAI